MREIIQKVIATEAEAKQRVQAAKTEATRILTEAQKHAQELTAAARREAQLAAQEIVAAATKEAEIEKQTRLRQFAVELENQIRLDEATKQRVIAAVARCVCG